MKKIVFSPIACLAFVFALAFSTPAFSQDDIIMRNDDVIKAKVEEVGLDVIKYRKADNMDGPMYDLSKANVYMIVYANGSRDVINPRGNESPAPAPAPVVVDEPVRVAPPEMPVYEQPYCPAEGYLWTPGYWAWGFSGYYWVPGVWVRPPYRGYLWTPGYWGYAGGFYGWHDGYWGEHVGFYGGVHYGYGYEGSGYHGGHWEGGSFRYNTAVSRVDVTVVHNTYVDHTVVTNTVVNHSSFNGEGGVRAQPSPVERQAAAEKHVNHTPEQQSHVATARNDKSQYVSANGGKPAVIAVNKPNGEHFSPEGHVTTPMRANPPANNNNNAVHGGNPVHPNGENPAHPVQNEPHNGQPASPHQEHGSQPNGQPGALPHGENRPVQNEPHNSQPAPTHPMQNEPPHNSQPAPTHPVQSEPRNAPPVQQHQPSQPASQQHNAPQNHPNNAPRPAAPRPAPSRPAPKSEHH